MNKLTILKDGNKTRIMLDDKEIESVTDYEIFSCFTGLAEIKLTLVVEYPFETVEEIGKESKPMKKKVEEMTEKEILRQQLELLAEHSITCKSDEIAGITNAMLSICELLVEIS